MVDDTLHNSYDEIDDLTSIPFDSFTYSYNSKVKIKDLFMDHYDQLVEWDETGKARPTILENVQRCLLCNTKYLGYDVFGCPECGKTRLLYRHCHARVCNSCGVKYQKQLAAKAEFMCIDVTHRHVIFTIPEEYRDLFRRHRELLNVLFVAARNTICKMFNKSLYAKCKTKNNSYYVYKDFKDQRKFGMIATIHTFGRDLKWNPHIHALIPEAYYDPKTDSYHLFHHFDYTFLRKTWQYELNRLLSDYFKMTTSKNEFNKLKIQSYDKYKQGYYVYAKTQDDKQNVSASFSSKDVSKNVGGCINYMVRYASRPAMAESRITSYDRKTDKISWYYEDHATGKRVDVTTDTGLDLLKKIIIHIPDKYFSCVRYYGFYNNKEQKILNRMHELLNNYKKMYKNKQEKKQKLQQKLDKLKYRTLCRDSFNTDVLKCTCGCTMCYMQTMNPFEEGITNDKYYREICINEMRILRIRGKSS